MSHWIRSRDALARLAEELAACSAIALDTEADSLHRYQEKVCLIQLASDAGGAWLVDPLELDDLSPLGPLLADPAVVKVLHGADYDVSLLKRDFGFEIAGLFDTMLAARLLGMPGVGLQAVAEAELGIHLSKGSQKDDWSRRPLSPTQETYALADVQHLVALRERLRARLEGLGRLAWLREECEAVAALPAARSERDPEAYRRIKGASRLTRQGLAVLRELYGWRDSVAASRDVPAFKVLGNDVLVALAQRPPRSAQQLQEHPARGRSLQRYARPVLAAIETALSRQPEQWPAVERRARPAVPESVRKRAAALKRWRGEQATTLGLDVSVVLPQRLIDKVAEAGPRDRTALAAVDGLRRWRVDAFGEQLLATLRAA